MRADWVDKNPKATKAILKAVMEAQQWCDKQENRKELAEIVAKASYFNVPAATLEPMFMGKYVMGDGQPDVDDFNMAVRYWKTDRGSISYPYKSLDLWFLTESVRWGFLPKTYLESSKNLIDKVNRSDLWKEAAKEAGVPAADIPTGDSRGVEKFFDGKVFDPANPKAYLDSLAIKKV
jgi:bicarbonate transport system substrate-binding protein